MILSKLSLKNFKRYKAFSIEFHDGLIGIIGKNGSGKSTIFEAILFALYGELKSRGTKEMIRNAEATTKDVVVVELLFEIENFEYKIIREFRGKALTANAKLYKNEELVTSGAKEVTSSIIKLTKLSKDAFIHTLFSSQKELTSLSTLKNEDRKKMIRKLLGLEKIDFIEQELIQKSRELKREINAFSEVLLSDDEIKNKQEQIAQKRKTKKQFLERSKTKEKQLKLLKEREEKLKKTVEVFLQTKEKVQKLTAAFELTKNRLNAEKSNQKKLKDELSELKKKEEELKMLGDIKNRYLQAQTQLKEQEKLKEYKLQTDGLQKELTQLREQYTKSKSDISKLSKECAPYLDILNAVKEQEQKLKPRQELLLNYATQEQKFLSQIAAEQREVDVANEKIKNIQNLGRESACPTCTRPLLEEYDNVITSLMDIVQNTQQKKIGSLQNELKQLQTSKKASELQKEQIEKELQNLYQKINIIESKQKDLKNAQEHFKKIEEKGLQNKTQLQELQKYHYDRKLHQKKEQEYEAIKVKYEHSLILQTQLKRGEKITQELTMLSSKIIELNTDLLKIEKELHTIKYNAKDHQEKQKEYENTLKERDAQVEKLNNLKVQTATLDGEINTIEITLHNNQTQLKKVQNKKDDLKDYEKIKISLTAFKSKLNARIAPRISTVASQMYTQITKGKYQHIEVNNEFDFFIYDKGKKYPIERFSGGEIDLANLVLRIAISKTVTELSGASSIGFLAFDEVFGSQDENRRVEILEAFHTIKEQYRQIFLISHEMEIKEMFEQVLEL